MKIALFSIVFVLFTSCVNCQTGETLFVERANPDKVGVDSNLISKLIYDIKTDKIKNIHSLLIIKYDKLIVEEYFGDFSQGRLQYTASVSKSFASTLLGIAIDKGFFGDDIQTVLNKNVAELFPKYADIIKKDPLKANLKLKHILSMTAGFEWDEHTFPYSDGRNDCIRINSSDDPMKFLFERKLIHQPGTEFYYNGGLSLSISYLIEKYTKMSVDDFAEEYFFNPLEITDYIWENLANGLIDTDGGLHLKPSDQAKLGYLFLNNGAWNKTQIVSKEWVQIASKMHIKNNGMPNYGYQWWGGDFGVLNQIYPMYLASGHGGQRIVVIPQFNTVIVITQQVFNNPYADINFLAIMGDYINSAIVNDKKQNSNLILTAEQLIEYIGHYELKEGGEYIDFKIEDNILVGYSSDGQKNIFTPFHKSVFKTRVMDILDIYIEFINNSTGEIESIKSNFAFTSKWYNKRI
jgi:CubicO group peptidase (beta-lactamase class C family)